VRVSEVFLFDPAPIEFAEAGQSGAGVTEIRVDRNKFETAAFGECGQIFFLSSVVESFEGEGRCGALSRIAGNVDGVDLSPIREFLSIKQEDGLPLQADGEVPETGVGLKNRFEMFKVIGPMSPEEVATGRQGGSLDRVSFEFHTPFREGIDEFLGDQLIKGFVVSRVESNGSLFIASPERKAMNVGIEASPEECLRESCQWLQVAVFEDFGREDVHRELAVFLP
jgi:hypothetical protein